MAKLIIYHGDVLEQEVELGEQNARIGRGPGNDIVLADPNRSVSRRHAEVQFEQNQYSLVDSNSQNGLWVEGRRVPKIQLVPGVPVVMGSYKLVLKQERPPREESNDATVVIRRPDAADAATVVRRIPTPPGDAADTIIRKIPTPPAPAPVAEAAPPPAVAKEVPAPAPPPEPKPEPKPAPPPAAVGPPKPAPKPPPPAPPPRPVPAPAAVAPRVTAKPARGISKGLVFGGLAVIVVAGTAAALFLSPLKRWVGLTPTESETPAASPRPTAAAPTRPAQPVAPPPVPARVAVQTPMATPPAAPRPTKPRLKPVPARASTPAAPAPVKEKPPDVAGMFEEARSAIIRGDYLAAIAGLEAVLKLDASYPNAENLLDVARGGATNASQLAIDSGNQAEMRADYATAAKHYQRALQLDPRSTGAVDALRRLKARMQGEGEDALKRAKAHETAGRKQEAISAYEKAIELLPTDHPSAKTARDSLAALKGG